jgi:putative transposase
VVLLVFRGDRTPRPRAVAARRRGGVDLGIKSLAVLSTGEVIANPKHLEIAQRVLRRLHTAVANARRDGLHKLTTRLVREHGTVVIEDLHVAGMLRNRRLARRIAGVGMAELRRQIEYKSGWAGGRVHRADRWSPSSKTCSGCGVVKAKLRLSERMFRCEECGLVLDRDLTPPVISPHSWPRSSAARPPRVAGRR